MFDALQIAATGMQAQQMNVDTVANNLANVNTVGYKKSHIVFSDLVMAGPSQVAQAELSARAQDVSGRFGAGVAISTIHKLFEQGNARQTDSPMDLLIAGDGFVEVSLADGTRGFMRGGTLKVGADGALGTVSGLPLKSNIVVPPNTETLTIGVDGKVSAKQQSQKSPTEIGVIEMAKFANPGALEALGDGIYRATAFSGDPIPGRAGEDGMGVIRQGQLEGSNVKLVEEMVNLMVAQRAYEASVKVAQASDEMLGLINNLRK